ncbi:hypothetical protein UACE39S_04822 [Ureibacillus acetophenoni]
MSSCKVAVVQAGSIVMNKEKCIDKAINLIQEAGDQGANIIVFPEAYIPAYPRGMSFGAVVGSRTAKDVMSFYDIQLTLLPFRDQKQID